MKKTFIFYFYLLFLLIRLRIFGMGFTDFWNGFYGFLEWQLLNTVLDSVKGGLRIFEIPFTDNCCNFRKSVLYMFQRGIKPMTKSNEMQKVKNLSEFDGLDTLKNKLVVSDNCFMTKITKWTTLENKLAFIALSQIKTLNNQNKVMIKADDVRKHLDTKMSNAKLRWLLKKMAQNSWIEYEDADGFKDGFLFVSQSLSYTSGYIYIGIGEDYLPLFQNLSSNFTMIELDALLSFTSKYSIILTQFINSNYDLKNLEKETLFGNREQLWRLFWLSDDQYLIKVKEKEDPKNVEYFFLDDGTKVKNMGYKPPKPTPRNYRWPDFEKEVLARACDEINSVSNILGYTISFQKQIERSDFGHYVDGYLIFIQKAKKEKSQKIIDVASFSKQLESSEKSVADQLKKECAKLMEDKETPENIKKLLEKLNFTDFKEMESNILSIGKKPTVANLYYQTCILNYLTNHSKSTKKVVKLPAYYDELKNMKEQPPASPEEIAEVEKMLKEIGNKKGD